MTAQDWWPRLAEEADKEPAGAPPRPRRRALAAVGALTVGLVLAALVVVLVSRVGSPPGATVATAAAPSSPSAAPAKAPREGAVVIEAALRDPRVADPVVGAPGPLIVDTQPLQGGVAPDRVPNFDTCHADPATLQYLPVQIRRPALWLTATVTVQTTATTPAGIGRLGFFFQAGDASAPCPNGAWSTSDSFQASNVGQEVITGYIVLDQAITPSTRTGRADVFRTLQLRVSNVNLGGPPLLVSPPTVGSLCPGTQNDLCAALG